MRDFGFVFFDIYINFTLYPTLDLNRVFSVIVLVLSDKSKSNKSPPFLGFLPSVASAAMGDPNHYFWGVGGGVTQKSLSKSRLYHGGDWVFRVTPISTAWRHNF